MFALHPKAAFEKIPVPEDESFVAREFEVPRFDAPWHFHPEVEITLILTSRGQRFVGDHIGSFEPGDLVMLGPGLPHLWHNGVEGAGKGGASCRIIQFHAGLFGRPIMDAPEMRRVSALMARVARGVRFDGEVVAAAGEQMRKLTGLRGGARLAGLLELLELLAGWSRYESLSSAGFAPRLDTLAAGRIGRCHEYVFANFEDGVELSAAAAAAGMQANAFSRYFKKVTGKTFSSFVNEVRVGHACRLLLAGDEPVAEICHRSGFGNLSNFNRRFREIKGCSPREFRARY